MRLMTLLFAGALAAMMAQEPVPKPAEAPKAAEVKPDTTPEDVKALREARKITDPQKKVEALEKVIADFPNSANTVYTARGEIGDLLLRMTPLPEGKILDTARVMIASRESPEDRAVALFGIARRFFDRGVLLEEAEAFAREAVKLSDEKKFFEQQRKVASDNKRPVPSDADISLRFRQMKGDRQGLLGRIQLRRGDHEGAERNLRQAYKLNPNIGAIPLALAEIADLRFQRARALEYLVAARLIGGPTSAEAKHKLEAAWRRRHNDSLDGLEDFLDEQHRKMFPPPIQVERYVPTAARTDRVVLVELFTGAGCPPCVSADLAFDAALERYTRDEMALVAYHLHIPRPDPMTNVDSQARQKFYNVNGVPSYYIDGDRDGGGGPRSYTKENWERVRPKIEKRLETPPGAKLSVDALMAGGKVNVTAGVSDVRADAKDVRLHIVLVEEHLAYSGENGIRFHAMVARAIAGEGAGGYPAGPVTHTFDLAKVVEDAGKHLDDYEVNGRQGRITFLARMHEINPAHLGLVVFAQDGATKEILQSKYLRLAPRAISRAGE
jgi:tetratricopeptide (TPR) repeat protein